MLIRNGTRHPQLRNADSPTSAAVPLSAAVESTMPRGAPALVKLAQRPRRPVACSADISTAPPHSPPTAMPWITRSSTSAMGASVPICSGVGSRPMRKLATPIRVMVSTSIRFRPRRSPKWPKTIPPSGRAR